MKRLLITSASVIFAINAVVANAAPVEISRNGKELSYVSDVRPGNEGMSAEAIQFAHQFGTYQSLADSVTPTVDKVWVGTVVTKEGDRCTATVNSVDHMDEREVRIGKHVAHPGTPVMKVTSSAVDCPV
jgi:hypothetical protein